MDFIKLGSASDLFSHCQQIVCIKRLKRDSDLHVGITKCLHNRRDAIKKEIIKEYASGQIQSEEYQEWLRKVGDIERQENDILKAEEKSSISHLKRHAQLLNMLDEMTDSLERSPFGHGSIINAPHGVTKALTSPRTEGMAYRRTKDSLKVTFRRKSGTKGEPNVKAGMSVAQRKAGYVETLVAPSSVDIPLSEHKKNQCFVAAEGKAVPWQSEIQEVSTVGPKGDVMATPSSVSRIPWEITPSSAPKYKSLAKQKKKYLEAAKEGKAVPWQSEIQEVSAVGPKGDRMATLSNESDIPWEITPSSAPKLLSADQVPLSTKEVDLISFKTEGELSMHGTEIVEIIPDANERMLSIHEQNIESEPSLFDEPEPSLFEDQMKPNLSMNLKRSTEPIMPVEFSSSGPGNGASVESTTVPPLRKEGDISLVHEADIQIPCQSGGGQVLPEQEVKAKRSIEHTVQKILRCMTDGTTRRIGVYGSGGIGKTSVLKALINHLETKNMFDETIWVTLSRYWSTRKIQNEVLRQLSVCPADAKTDSEIAEKLFEYLSNKKFLLLLDDIWERIDLKAVGIPDLSSENECTMILATRSLDVCHDMGESMVMEVEAVSREEAWELFHEQVGEIVNSPGIQPYAKAIVEECGGLPLLVIVTGSALTEENDVSVWKHALREFLSSSTLHRDDINPVIQRLRFSYDRLKSYDIKSVFLYCALFPEDQEIKISELVEYCIQEGLLAGNWANANKRGHDIVDILVGTSLLQKTEGGLSIKMHDLIRDLALEILSSEAEGFQFLVRANSSLKQPSHPRYNSSSRPVESPERNRSLIPEVHQFSLRAGAGLTEPPLMDEWKQAKMIFWMDNDLSILPDRPICPKLLALFLQRNHHLRVIPVAFFDFMPSLKVLNLSKTRIKALPLSLFNLENLQVLILHDCERLLQLPPEIGSLKNLEVLDLEGTEINRLPDEIGQLASLKFFEVSFYGSVNHSEYVRLPHELVSHGIISRLLALETLSVVVYPGDQRWNKIVKSVIDDVCNLKRLASLCFYFPEVELLELFLKTSPSWNSEGLTNFNFVVGHDVKRIVSRVSDYVEFDYNRWGRWLRFVNGKMIPKAVVDVLTRTTAFYLDHHLDIHSLSKFGLSSINGLKLCIVRDCPMVQTIINGKELTDSVFPFLEHLSIHYLCNLRRIWEGMMPCGSFASLRILLVHTCPILQFVFTSSMLQFVSNLEELVVEDCPAIKEIISEDEIVDSGRIILPSLKRLKLHYLPGLNNTWKGAWPSLEHISVYNCPNLKNIGMDSKLKDTIKEIKAEKDWWKGLKWGLEWDETALLHLQAHFTEISGGDL